MEVVAAFALQRRTSRAYPAFLALPTANLRLDPLFALVTVATLASLIPTCTAVWRARCVTTMQHHQVSAQQHQTYPAHVTVVSLVTAQVAASVRREPINQAHPAFRVQHTVALHLEPFLWARVLATLASLAT